MTHLRPVTLRDIVPLHEVTLTDAQDRFVAPHAVTIAQAAYETGAYIWAIWDDEQIVGLMAALDFREHDDVGEIDHPEAAYLWRLSVGEDHQKKGHGRAAVQAFLDWGRKRGNPVAQVQAMKGNDVAIALYESFGFVKTGKMEGEEFQFEMPLLPK